MIRWKTALVSCSFLTGFNNHGPFLFGHGLVTYEIVYVSTNVSIYAHTQKYIKMYLERENFEKKFIC